MSDMIIYEDFSLYVQKEESEVPWLKIFTKEPYKELSDVPQGLRHKIWETYDLIEYEMIHYYNPTKINMASFANVLPRVHIHVMARFEDDSYFPQPMWGEKQRTARLKLPSEEEFHKRVFNALTSKHN